MAPTYPVLDVVEFGRRTIQSLDLDPVYVALNRMNMPEDQLKRWLLAYWCFYDCGVASWMSEFEQSQYWSQMLLAAKNTDPAPHGGRWARGKERRHFRGAVCVKAVEKMALNHPEPIVNKMTDPSRSERSDTADASGNLTLADITDEVRTWPLFGPWIAFKIADMAERVLDIPVDFDEGEVFLFRDPYEAAIQVWRCRMMLPDSAVPKNPRDVIHRVVEMLLGALCDLRAPGGRDRALNIQEIETVLCKWKSHRNGHYPLDNDRTEIRHGLQAWRPHCSTAGHFAEALP